MRMPNGYQIPDDPDAGRMDAAYLRTCLGIPTPLSGEMPPFPLQVRQAHFHMTHALRRLSALSPRGMDATQLATVVALAAMQPDPTTMFGEEEKYVGPPRTFRDDVNDGRVSEGKKVVALYRGVEQAGHFLRVAGEKIVVLLDGHERKVEPHHVRCCKPGELPNVPDNINEPCVAE